MRIAKLRWERAEECDIQDVAARLGLEIHNGATSCPAHFDKNPSLTVSTRYPNILFCYSCAAMSGNKNGAYPPIRLVQTVLDVSRVGALEWIEKEFSLSVLPNEPGEPIQEEERLPHTWIITVMNLLAENCLEYFRNNGPGTERAYAYLKQRRIQVCVAQKVPIGVLPPNLDVNVLASLLDAAVGRDRDLLFEQIDLEKKALTKEEDIATLGVFYERRMAAEDKKIADFRERVLKLHQYDGCLITFNEDRYGNYISAEFRPGTRNKDGKTIVWSLRPGRQGLFGLRITDKSVSEKQNNVLLCVEGPMNLLRYWSEQAQIAAAAGHKRDWDESLCDVVALGSAAAWDHKNLLSVLRDYERVPAVMYDRGEKGSINATRQMLEKCSLIAFTTPPDRKAKDLDELFNEGGLTSADVMAYLVTQVDDENNYLPRDWEMVAQDIKYQRNNAGKVFEINDKVAGIIQQDLRERGGLHHGDNHFAYAWFRKEHRLIKLDKEDVFFGGILDRYGIFQNDDLAKATTNQIGLRVARDQEVENFHDFAYNDAVRNCSYFYLGNGHVAYVDSNEIKLVRNGTDGVLFYENIEPFEVNLSALPKLERGLRAVPGDALYDACIAPFENNLAEMTQLHVLLVMARYFTQVVGRSPCLQWVGEWGSAKSSSACWMGRLLQGNIFTMNSMSDDMDDLETAGINKPCLVLDNVDGVKKDKDERMNFIATCVTGEVKIGRRKHYSNSILLEWTVKNAPILTAQQSPFMRPDVVSRSVFFKLSKHVLETNSLFAKSRNLSEGELKALTMAQRNPTIAEVLVRAQHIHRALAATEGKTYPRLFRLRGLEKFALRIADYEGWLQECQQMFVLASEEQESKKSESSDLEQALRLFIGSNSARLGRQCMAAQICKICAELCSSADIHFAWQGNPTWFARTLQSDRSSLETKLGLQILDPRSEGGKTRKACKYWFEPDPEVVQECVAEARQLGLATDWKQERVGEELLV